MSIRIIATSILSAGSLLTAGECHGQTGVAINANGAAPHASAMLDVDVSALPENGKLGLLIPRVTTNAQRTSIAGAGNGLLVYQTLPAASRGFWYWDGSAWVRMGLAGWNLTGNAGTVAANFLGTTDNQPMVFRTNNLERLRITTKGQWVPGNTQNSVYIGEGAGETDAAGPASFASNVFVGWQAGYTARGQRNTAMGPGALRNAGTTFENTALGNEALANNTTGSYNTAIGAHAGVDAPGTWSYATSMGYQARARENGTAIGATSSAQGTNATALGYGASALYANSTALGNGSVTTGTDQVRVGNTVVTSIGGYAPWTDLSDIRFKTDVAPLTHGLDLVRRLRPITYRLDIHGLNAFLGTADKVDEEAVARKEAIRYSGFSAQDVEAATKAIGYDFNGVHTPQHQLDPYGLSYAVFVAPLVKAVQELDAEHARLQAEMEGLERRLQQLETKQHKR